jgi:hypothetical protein
MQKKKLKDEDIYINNKKVIDKFIDFYNKVKIKEGNCEKLSIDKPLCYFLLVIEIILE